MSDDLVRFCQEFLIDDDPVAALIRCGVPKSEAPRISETLMAQESTWLYIEISRNQRLYSQDPRYQNPPPAILDNIFYCCTQKTGSQWLKAVLRDHAFFQATGMPILPYISFGNRFAQFAGPMPANTVVTHLYIGRDAYGAIPKPASYKCFYVARDPRDALVSWFYSAKFSHIGVDPIPRLRRVLQEMSEDDGYCHLIDALHGWGVYDSQRSWFELDGGDFRLFRYEDLASDEAAFITQLFAYLNLEMPAEVMNDLVDRHHFAKYANGRQKGDEDQTSHYRAGRVGEWRARLSNRVVQHFRSATGDLAELMGYPA